MKMKLKQPAKISIMYTNLLQDVAVVSYSLKLLKSDFQRWYRKNLVFNDTFKEI